MPDFNTITKTLTIRGRTEGVDEAAASVGKLRDEYGRFIKTSETTAKVTDTVSKSQLSLSDSFAKTERRFNSSIRAQQDFEKVQRQMNMAVAQNPALQARANAVLALAATHFDQASKGQRVFAGAIQAANDNMRSFAASAGPLGSVLAALGPGGIVAAAGIGAAAIALHQMLTAATNLADRAGKLKDFSETTGFTVIQLQALEKAGAQVGVSAESVAKGLERFSVQMVDVRLQTGETYEKLLALGGGLAQQISTASSLSRAYELVSKAIKGTDLERANQIARAFFGRSGVEQTRLMRVVGDTAGLKGVIDELHKADVITAQQAERWDTLGDKIAENMKAAKQNIASIFTEDVLSAAEKFSKAFLDFTRSVKEFGINEDLRTFIEFFQNKAVQGALAGGLAGALAGGPVGAAIGAVSGAVAGGAVQLHDVEKIRETTEELKRQEDALGRANEKLEHYRKLSVAPDNHWAKADAERAAELERIVGRITQRVQALRGELKGVPTHIGTVTPGSTTQDAGAEAAKKAAEEQERLRQSIIASYNEMARWMSVIGSAATMAERYELATRKLSAAKAEGKINEEQYGRAVAAQKQQLELRLGVADMQKVTEEQLAQVREVTANAGFSVEQQRLAVQIAIVEAKERENAAWRRANPEMAIALDMGEKLAQTMLQLAYGTGTFSDAMKGLSATLASDSIRSLFKGDLMAAGLQAIGAAITGGMGILTDDSAEKEIQKARVTWAGMSSELRDFNAIANGFDLSGPAQELRRIQDQFAELSKAAVKAGDWAAQDRLVQSQQRALGNVLDRFVNPTADLTAEAAKIKSFDGAVQQMLDEVQAAGANGAVLAGISERLFTSVTKQIADLKKKAADIVAADLNEALGKGFLNDIAAALAKRDQLKLEGIVDTTLIDKLFVAQAQKIVDGADLAGDAFADLVKMFPSLTGLVRESTSALEKQAEAQKQLQEQLDNAAKSILDYINSVNLGSESALTPQAQLTSAQSTFNATRALAQQNNVEALGRITSDAENLRKALQGFFGSSTGYQTGWQTIQNQLLALPAVADSVDPIVQALTTVKAAVDVNTQSTASLLNTSVARLNTAVENLVSVVSYLSSVVNRLDTGNAILAALQGLQTTASSQLTILNSNFGQASTTGSSPGVPDANNLTGSAIDALRKIVYNTGIIANNTHGSANKGTGTFAQGGTLAPFGIGIFGEHHPQGPFIARAGSQPIPITPSMPSFAGGANDNSAVVAVVKQLIARIGQLEARLVQAEVAGAEHVAAKVDRVARGVEEDARERKMDAQAA